jgi:hypothetical protein
MQLVDIELFLRFTLAEFCKDFHVARVVYAFILLIQSQYYFTLFDLISSCKRHSRFFTFVVLN